MDNRTKTLVLASVAGLLAAAAMAPTTTQAADAKKVPCYGINKCKGTGDCGGKGHSCAGKNACKGQGYVELAKEDCLRIQGGSLTPSEG